MPAFLCAPETLLRHIFTDVLPPWSTFSPALIWQLPPGQVSRGEDTGELYIDVLLPYSVFSSGNKWFMYPGGTFRQEYVPPPPPPISWVKSQASTGMNNEMRTMTTTTTTTTMMMMMITGLSITGWINGHVWCYGSRDR